MKTTVNIFRTLLLAVLTLTFGACGEDSLLSELGLDGQTSTKVDGAGKVWDGTVATAFAGGSGTAEAPYLIANGAQLKRFAAIVNGTDGMARNTAACGKLTADILLNDISNWTSWNETTAPANTWTPIGSEWENFTGTLDGQGHSVSGIYINSEADYQGLVGVLGSGGALQNLGVKASYIKGSNFVGGVCGMNMMGNVINCYNTGNVTGGSEVGGVCGYNRGTVSNCYNSGSVTGTDIWFIGGVCGGNVFGNVTNCYNTGSVTGTGDYVGGVCGNNDGDTVTNCYYLIGTANSGIGSGSGEATAKTAEQFQSGEVAYLLQGKQAEQVWGQNLTLDPKDTYPVLGGLKVVQNGEGYANELKQDGDFYLISTADELRLFASMVNSGQTRISAKLTADIELNNTTGWENWGNTPPANSWTPIGDYFTGTFDGQGHTISGLYYVNNPDYPSHYVGLFGSLENGGTVENVGVTKSYIQSSGYAGYTGGIVGLMNSGTIRNCYCTGIVRCQGYGGGGIVGMNYGYDNSTIENCYFAGSISSQYGYDEMIGPIVGGRGAEYVNPTNCYYLEGCGASGKGTSKTAKQFQSGEVASLLGEGWGQTIGTDDYPVPTSDASKKVYAYTMYQGQSTETGYANNNGSIDLDLASHPNTIAVFEASGTFSGKNIVVKDGDNNYTCAELVLADGEDFYTPVKFTATKATYTRSPKVWATKGGSGSGWETLCLPFSGTLYAGEDAKKPVLTDLAGDYWLRSLTGFKTPNTLIFASGSTATAADHQIKAGVPYIIALPGNTFGDESLEGQTISVRGTDVAVTNVPQSVQPEGSWLAFTGTFATKACDAASYRLNSENGSDGAGDLFELDTKELDPFRCRIDVKGLIIGGASTRSASGLPKELRIGQ